MSNSNQFNAEFSKLLKSLANANPGSPKFVKFIFMFLVTVVIGAVLIKVFFVNIGPNEYGIKVKLMGSNAGVQKDVFQTGLHFVVPAVNAIERFPKDIQIIELTAYPNRHSSFPRKRTVGRVAHIQTSDGFWVDVDISILYKITDPYTVMTTLGKRGIYESSILPKVEPALKRTLGQLTTEEFYQSTLRVAKMNAAKDMLHDEFKQNGLEVMAVQVRYFKYSDEIQKNIEEKKLKDQLVFKNQAEGRAAHEAAILKKIIKEGEANMAVALEEGKAYVTKKNAEMQLYSRKKKAEANLLTKTAEANKTKLRNAALKVGGSENLVGIEMAKALEGVDTLILSSDGSGGINPLNLKNTLKTFDVK